ncbi:MAG: SUMF1/EgtB/PvdO family nonheme iron enzyme [Phycisphaerales bacterium]|nr:SUMF1/EgtB/PvdO family nonheme iron enzyme [Phycisphaerales bacterium]
MAIVLLAVTPVTRADIDPVSGIDFVRIGAVGNAAWPGRGDPTDNTVGRGSVAYEYSISRFEVTTADWVPFFNAVFDRPANDRIPFVPLAPEPSYWGAQSVTPTHPGGQRWAVRPGQEMRPVGDISWRMAAIFCNWNHHGRALNREAFLSGAYDTATFGFTGPNNITFTDQATRSPGARYWIPSLDEWMKAAHYDPNKNGLGQGGWWNYSTTSDTVPVYGPPGVRVTTGVFPVVADPSGPLAQANALWNTDGFPNLNPFSVPLGAYSVTSPWGLYDTAGATTEWTEEIRTLSTGEKFRRVEGSFWSFPVSASDFVGRTGGGEFPNVPTYEFGFRVASSIPGSGTAALAIGCVLHLGCRRKR